MSESRNKDSAASIFSCNELLHFLQPIPRLPQTDDPRMVVVQGNTLLPAVNVRDDDIVLLIKMPVFLSMHQYTKESTRNISRGLPRFDSWSINASNIPPVACLIFCKNRTKLIGNNQRPS